MTQVRFKAKAKGDGVFIDVKENGIKLRNLESKGTFTLSAAGAASWSITEGNLTEYTAVFPETKEITNAEAKKSLCCGQGTDTASAGVRRKNR